MTRLLVLAALLLLPSIALAGDHTKPDPKADQEISDAHRGALDEDDRSLVVRLKSPDGPFPFATSPDAALNMAKLTNQAVVVWAVADWCGACHAMVDKSAFDPSLKPYGIQMIHAALDLSNVESKEAQQWVRQYKLNSTPTLLVFDKKGNLHKKLIGYQSASQLRAAFDEVR